MTLSTEVARHKRSCGCNLTCKIQVASHMVLQGSPCPSNISDLVKTSSSSCHIVDELDKTLSEANQFWEVGTFTYLINDPMKR